MQAAGVLADWSVVTRRLRRWVAIGATVVVGLTACANGSSQTTPVSRPAGTTSSGPTTGRPPVGSNLPITGSGPPLYAHYYLWWDANHWRERLGPAYPLTRRPLPLPAGLDANGCGPQPRFSGARLADVPAPDLGLYSQDDPAVLRRHVEEAAQTGINGFVVSWAGTGAPDQNDTSRAFNHRLRLLADAVAQHNAAGGPHFSLAIGYEGLNDARQPRPVGWARNDLAWFIANFGNHPAFTGTPYGARPLVMFLDSRKWTVDALRAATTPVRGRVLLVGDEHGKLEWSRGVSSLFDGDGWYWSEEDPYRNPHAFTTLQRLADVLHADHKLWFAPLAPGYDKSIAGGKCVPRHDTATLKVLFAGNRRSHPDGWMAISWNEFFENTYLEPSARYGTRYLDTLQQLRQS